MDPPFSEGEQSSSYTNQQMVAGAGQQSSCMPELSSMDSYYTPCPVAQELSPHPSETGSLPPASTLYQHQQLPRSTQSPGALASMTSNPQNVPRSHHIWPSPPPGPDELDNCSYDSSPTCVSSQPGYNPSPVSPKIWSSPHHPYQHTSDPFLQHHQQESLKGLQLGTPTSTSSLPVRGSQTLTPHASSAGRPTDGMPRDNSLVSLSDLTTKGFSGTSSPVDLDLSPRAYMPVTNKSEAPPTNRPSSLTSSASRELNDHGPTNKGEEPYAQLIYRAFMSRSDYSMTLQEIYQWFRENTDKAKSESKGWQNSIRHNLSMNAAFTKRERKPASPSVTILGDQVSLPAIHDPKKSTEWVLADWAVRNGVQSTTRYRKGNPTRSRGHGKLMSHGFHYGFQHGGSRISTKATSGRKGGCATSRSKLRGRHFSQGSHSHLPSAALAHGGLPIGPHPIRPIMLPGMFPPHYGGEQLLLPRLEPPPQMGIKHEPAYSPLTPETTAPDSSFGLMLPEPSLASHHAHGAASASSIQDATYSLVNGGQGSMYSHFPYGANDVTGVYHPGQYHDLPPQRSSSQQVPLGPGGNGHHFGTLHNESYEWNNAAAL